MTRQQNYFYFLSYTAGVTDLTIFSISIPSDCQAPYEELI